MKLCPKCGSTDVIPMVGGILGIWKCEKCGFSGTIFPDVEKLEEEEKDDKKIKKGKKSMEKKVKRK